MLTHLTDATIALAKSYTNNSSGDAIIVYGDPSLTPIKTFSLMPANNVNFSIIGQALALNKTELGITLNTDTLATLSGQLISPIEKTLSNCVLGS